MYQVLVLKYRAKNDVGAMQVFTRAVLFNKDGTVEVAMDYPSAELRDPEQRDPIAEAIQGIAKRARTCATRNRHPVRSSTAKAHRSSGAWCRGRTNTIRQEWFSEGGSYHFKGDPRVIASTGGMAAAFRAPSTAASRPTIRPKARPARFALADYKKRQADNRLRKPKNKNQPIRPNDLPPLSPLVAVDRPSKADKIPATGRRASYRRDQAHVDHLPSLVGRCPGRSLKGWNLLWRHLRAKKLKPARKTKPATGQRRRRGKPDPRLIAPPWSERAFEPLPIVAGNASAATRWCRNCRRASVMQMLVEFKTHRNGVDRFTDGPKLMGLACRVLGIRDFAEAVRGPDEWSNWWAHSPLDDWLVMRLGKLARTRARCVIVG